MIATDSNGEILPHYVRLIDGTIEEALEDSKKFILGVYGEDGYAEYERIVKAVIPLILYLCVDEPEIDNELKPDDKPKKVTLKKYATGQRVFPPKPRTWVVGKPLGDKIRESEESDKEITGGMKSPHVRRGHFHHYRHGEGRKLIKLKWLMPMHVDASRKDKQNPSPFDMEE